MLTGNDVNTAQGKRSVISDDGRERAHSRESPAVAQVAHELRNCLGTIGGAMRVLDIETLEEARRRQARTIVGRQLDQMSRLIGDLVDASLSHAGRLQLERARIDLRVPLGRALESVDFQVRQRRHRLQASMPAEPIWIHADSTRLEQVFMNLLVNACKYTQMGGEIDVVAESFQDEAVVCVSDTGIGISPDLLPELFEPYVRAQSDLGRGRAGLGLGLSLVRNLVQRHGGSIEAESAGLDRGSMFIVRLPITTSRH